MKKQDMIFILAAVVVIAVFVLLSVFSRKALPLTTRAEHAGMTKETARATCLECHAPDSAIAPMPARHPKKGKPPDKTTPCDACHKFPATSAVFINPARILEGAFTYGQTSSKGESPRVSQLH